MVKKKLDSILPRAKQFRYLPRVLSRKERSLIIVLFFLAVGALGVIPFTTFWHFTKAAPDLGGSFSEGMVGAPKYINPLLAQVSDVDRDLTKLVYAGLMKYNDQGELTHDLADSHEISNDGLVYTFKLKSDLQWHDKQPLTAEDIVFSILIAQNSDYGSFQRINWQGVEASKIDNQTVVFKLKNRYAQFLSNTTMGILPKHLWENVKSTSFGFSELNLKPVGAGPYRFSKIRKDSSGQVTRLKLSAFENYHFGQPNITKIQFKFYPSEDKMINAFNQNEIDNLSFISPQKFNSLRFPGKLNIKELRLPRYFAIFFNQNQSRQYSDKNVRLALNYGTDKKAIIEKVLKGRGLAVASPMLPGIIENFGNPVDNDFDRLKAEKILEDSGWKFSPDSNALRIRQKLPAPEKKPAQRSQTKTPPPEPLKLELKITTSNWPELIAVASELSQQWEQIGAKVNVEILALPELQQAIKVRDYEALLFGEVLGLDPDPFSFWHSSQKKNPGLNLALYDNKNADKLLEEARQILEKTERLKKYSEFQKIVIGDAPVVFLYSPYYLYASAKKIKANGTQIITLPSDRFNAVEKWHIETKRILRKNTR